MSRTPWEKENPENTTAFNLEPMKYEVKSYPDGGKYVNILNVGNLRLTYRINSYEDLGSWDK